MSRTAYEAAVRTLRLSADQLTEVLDELDQAAAGHADDRRAAKRYAYRLGSCVAYLQQPGSSSASTYQVVTRDLSATGLSFLHGSYVHGSTQCTFELVTVHGETVRVEAEVMNCRYVQNGVHVVGTRFARPIQPTDFTLEALQHRGAILAASQEEVDGLQALLAPHLYAVEGYLHGSALMNAVEARRPQLVVLTQSAEGCSGPYAVRTLRDQQYIGLIIAALETPDKETRLAYYKHGCDLCVGQPPAAAHLDLVFGLLTGKPVVSALRQEPALQPMINAFVLQLTALQRDFERALVERDAAALSHVTRTLRGQGSSFGFVELTTCAETLAAALRRGAPGPELAAAVQNLRGQCFGCRLAWLRDADPFDAEA